MFDNTRAVAKELQPEETQAVLASDAFASWDGVLNEKGCAQVRDYRGVRLNLYPEQGILRMEVTLPTFAYGHNTQLLELATMQTIVPELARAVGLPAERFDLVGLEMSIDTDLPVSPRPFLESLIHHKQSIFCAVKPPAGVARPLEYYATHADYGVKFYDKGAWAARHDNPLPAGLYRLRYELVLKRARAIQAMLDCEHVTLADLATPALYIAAAAALQSHWEQVVRDKPLDFTGLRPKDAALLYSGSSPKYWRGLKEARVPSITIKRHKAKFKQLLSESDKRTENDIYSQRLPAAIASLVAPALQTKTDTIFHTCSQSETVSFNRIKSSHPHHLLVSFQEDEERKEVEVNACLRRCCQTCGRPIAGNNPNAKFCSPKERGKAVAKRCRNADSNLRNNMRRRVQRLQCVPQLFDVRPFLRVPEELREFVLAP
ncbi:hypothetical protein SAMN00120144_4324 [Hymenobacter roseosalivarius DSM 11622]|uniref:Uncharacterized protein n=1 Tax=Hymenobacter roseosalivarius DSM 11622 TaxID=645990 RepID=A0A1W1W4W3_9BACT|nr:hypothetical protein [Hymenobacter roseosalivarius]SMC00657.1 hypothetical protein SAMN00120144_4324 [Hymenobacter roseosalivarius DSM 11622]